MGPAANATAEITSDAVEAAGPILQDAADATVEAAGRAAAVAGPVIRDAADATVEYAGKAADAAGPVIRDAAEATSQAASAAVEQIQFALAMLSSGNNGGLDSQALLEELQALSFLPDAVAEAVYTKFHP